jgi:ABC-type dipeptide/oligopeptide/nickel transport system permease subunit
MAQVGTRPTSTDTTEVPTGGEAIVGRSPSELFWRRFRQDKWAIAGLVFIFFLILMALLAPVVSKYVVHHGPNQLFVHTELNEYGLPKGPDGQFWFGSSADARDLFVQVMYGARTSLIVAFFATGIAMVIGVVLGVMAGFYRGKVDTVISRLIDVVLSLPVLLLALGLVSACGLSDTGCLGGLIKPGLLLVAYVIGLFSWPYVARIVRGQVLTLREKEFVEAARAQGSNNRRIMLKEVLPNIVAPIIVFSTLIIPSNILFEATLSFLGIGVPPTTPSWGAQIADATSIFQVAWWAMLFPGLFLFGTTLAFNLVGDGMRDALDPKSAGYSYKDKESKGKKRKKGARLEDVTVEQSSNGDPTLKGGS